MDTPELGGTALGCALVLAMIAAVSGLLAVGCYARWGDRAHFGLGGCKVEVHGEMIPEDRVRFVARGVEG